MNLADVRAEKTKLEEEEKRLQAKWNEEKASIERVRAIKKSIDETKSAMATGFRGKTGDIEIPPKRAGQWKVQAYKK